MSQASGRVKRPTMRLQLFRREKLSPSRNSRNPNYDSEFLARKLRSKCKRVAFDGVGTGGLQSLPSAMPSGLSDAGRGTSRHTSLLMKAGALRHHSSANRFTILECEAGDPYSTNNHQSKWVHPNRSKWLTNLKSCRALRSAALGLPPLYQPPPRAGTAQHRSQLVREHKSAGPPAPT